MPELTEPFNMTEMLRREYVQGSVDSVKYLEEFSNDETYQSHVYHLVSLLKLTEMALSIERYKNRRPKRGSMDDRKDMKRDEYV